MRRTLHVPIRHRILLALLLVVTAVVSAITFTMANLFHADKKVYVSDLASVVALNTAGKVDALITSYGERLMLCARVFEDPTLTRNRKFELLRDLMRGFRGCVAMTFWVGDQRVTALYDSVAIEQAGLTREAIEGYRTAHPFPMERLSSGRLVLENSTLIAAMPTVTIAVPGLRIPGQRPHVVAATLKMDELQRLSHSSQAFEVSLVDAHGTIVSHRESRLLLERRKLSPLPALDSPSSVVVKEYTREGVERIGGFAHVDVADLIVVAEIPKAAAFFASRELLRHLVVVALVLLVVAALVGTIWSRSLTRSIGRLAQATRLIASGNFDVHVDVKSGDEIGTLGESFNQMARELHERERALKDAQAQLIQSEKMAAFGQLGAGFAHEIKNPLAGIQGLVQLLQREVEKDSEVHHGLLTVEKETKRCRAIIDNLMKFARQEKVAFGPVDAAAVVADASAIMEHQLGIHGVKLEKSIEEGLPAIHGNPNQLQQVLMNLILNAQQAVEGRGGKVRVVAARGPEGLVDLRVEDNGPGIPKDIQARIFEPFFTTKPPGKGTGLGLSVSYGIVHEHKGKILLESEPGEGTKFILRLPETTEAPASGGAADKIAASAAPKQSTPAAAKQPAPAAAKHSTPAAAKQSTPAAVKQPAPAAVKQPAPTGAKQPEPAAAKQPAPAAARQPEPAPVKQPAPTAAKQPKPRPKTKQGQQNAA